ncbi:MAG: methyltransferase domain-containing protein [Actinomycetia bacterium]|nr:methyltransferase domain-containing protein [Actinomycetes bacterium]
MSESDVPDFDVTADPDEVTVDPDTLRAKVRDKYAEVAEHPDHQFHFHTGRDLAARCGYDRDAVNALPDAAVESFAGVANPFALRELQPGEKVLDAGCGAGFDSFLATRAVGESGEVVGVDMTPEMVGRAGRVADSMGLDSVRFREGLVEDLPVDDGWADVVISNGVLNLVADKKAGFTEIWRVLRPGCVYQFADIANGQTIPEEAVRDIDLWTA